MNLVFFSIESRKTKIIYFSTLRRIHLVVSIICWLFLNSMGKNSGGSIFFLWAIH